MTGLELLKAPEATAGEIADIISAPCPPTIPAHCDGVSCRECWLTWLTGEPIKEKEPPDKRTAPDEEGLHPNLVAFLRQRKHLLGVLEDVKDDVSLRDAHIGMCSEYRCRELIRLCNEVLARNNCVA